MSTEIELVLKTTVSAFENMDLSDSGQIASDSIKGHQIQTPLSTNGESRLLRLPAELRHKILHHLLIMPANNVTIRPTNLPDCPSYSKMYGSAMIRRPQPTNSSLFRVPTRKDGSPSWAVRHAVNRTKELIYDL